MEQRIATQFNCKIHIWLKQDEEGQWVVKYTFNDRSPRKLPQIPTGESAHEATTNALNQMERLVKDHLAQWMFKAYEDLAAASARKISTYNHM
jgi:hypothetical protein